MSKYSSAQFSIFLVDGYSLLAAAVQSVTHKIVNVLQAKTHGLGDGYAASSATGVLRGELAQSGAYFEDTPSGMHDAFKALTNVVRTVVFALAGNVIGKMFVGLQGTYEGAYAIITKVGALTLADAEYAISGQVDRGVIVQSWTQKVVNWNTFTDGFPVDYTLDPDNLATPITSATKANPCVVTTSVPHKLTTGDLILTSGNTLAAPSINSEQAVTVISPTTFSVAVNTSASTGAGTGGSFVRSSTNNGGVGYQLVSQYAGITGFVGKLRGSPDNITYADLIVFGNVAGAPPDATAAQRLTVAGVIPRYLCFTGTLTGAGSITPFAGFKRNPPQ